MGGSGESSGEGTKDKATNGRPEVDRTPLSDRGPEERSAEEQAEIDRRAGDVADDLADFA